jgi:hypothetical protein
MISHISEIVGPLSLDKFVDNKGKKWLLGGNCNRFKAVMFLQYIAGILVCKPTC